jgi:hypothetical protein
MNNPSPSRKSQFNPLTRVAGLHPTPEEPLMTLHQSSLRIRGVLHLLHEALQSGNGIGPSHAAAVCALIKSAETDLSEIDQSIDELIDLHLGRPRR